VQLAKASDASPSLTEERFSEEGITSARVLRFPDGDVVVTGCHFPRWGWRKGPKNTGSRPGAATPEELRKKAADRAKREIRHLVKFHSLGYLWSLTYRGPMTDRDRLLDDTDKYHRIVRRTYPDFKAVSVPELHQGGGVNHGGYHLHEAVNGFYDVRVLRAAWWEVVGEAQGNVQVEAPPARKKHDRHNQWKTGSIGNYLAKYVTKEVDSGSRLPGQHRYFRTDNLELPYERNVIMAPGDVAESMLLDWMGVSFEHIYQWHSEDGQRFYFSSFG